MKAITYHSNDFRDSTLLKPFQDNIESLGFGHWIYSAVDNQHETTSTNVKRISSYPKGFIDDYNSYNFHQVDPSTPYWLSNNKPASYRKVRRSVKLSARQSQLMDLNREYKVNKGILIPLNNFLGFKAVMALSFDGSIEDLNTYIVDVESELFSMSSAFNRNILSRQKSDFLNHSNSILTRQQYRVIKLLAQGLLTKQIADYLDISANGVDKHIANIKRVLSAKTTAEAVVLAVQWELI